MGGMSGTKRVILGAGAMLAILLMSMWMSFSRFAELERENAVNAQTYRTLLLTHEATRALIDMETGNRGFLLTGKESFRDPFYRGRNTFKARYADLLKLTANSPTQQRRLKFIKAKLTKWFALANPAIQARRKLGANAPIVLTGSEGQRKQLHDEMRGLLEEIQKEEESGLQKANARRSNLQFLSQGTLAFNALLATLFVVGLAWSLARGATRVENSNLELRRQVETSRRLERERTILANHNEQILNSTSEGIIGLNIKGRVTYANPAAAKMLGWEPEELIGKSWFDAVQHARADGTPADAKDSPIMASLRDMKARRVSDDTFWNRRGRHFPVEYAVTPLFEMQAEKPDERDTETTADASTGQGQQVGATLTFRNISERKQSEIALIRLASVVESSKDAILSHLPDGTIVSCNAAAVRLYGYAARNLESQPLATLFPPSSKREVELIVEHIQGGERIEPYQTKMLTKDEQRIEVALTFYPVLDARGNLMGASSNARPLRKGGGSELPDFDEAIASSADSIEPAEITAAWN